MRSIVALSPVLLFACGCGGATETQQQPVRTEPRQKAVRLDEKYVARIQCRTLVQACEQFAANNNGIYPAKLQDLVDSQYAGTPYIRDLADLYVPWGKQQERYQYAPPDPQRGSTQPHIWVIHPDGTVIGNPP